MPEVFPQRIFEHVGNDNRLSPEHGSAAGTGPWSNLLAVDRLTVCIGKVRGGAVMNVLTVFIQQHYGAEHLVELRFNQQYQAGENLLERRIVCDHLENPVLADEERFHPVITTTAETRKAFHDDCGLREKWLFSVCKWFRAGRGQYVPSNAIE